MRRLALFAFVTLACALLASPADKKKQEEQTQTLELPPEPPNAVVAEARRLTFAVTPLSAKGLLSQQVREALKWLLKQNHGSSVVKLRAFVAGSGDMRRVQAIVSEAFTDKRLPLPALSVIQVGALPLEGAQVVLESIAQQREDVNPGGLAFFSGQSTAINEPLKPMLPLVDQSLARLHTALRAAGLAPNDVLCLNCYLSSLDDSAAVRHSASAQFPHAAVDLVQRTREPYQSLAECEAVARLRTAPAKPLEFLNPQGLSLSKDFSAIALVGARRVVITGTQLAFGFRDSDARLAFERLGKILEAEQASFGDVAVSHVYPLSISLAEQVRKIRPEFYRRGELPAGTMLTFEGLPALDASFATDVIAILPDSP
jgi:enamine deaminase RidA (YjgF/YER057c/UK114 family)